ncbi:MAG: flavodoxin family protein [Cyanobacteriota bacterium]
MTQENKKLVTAFLGSARSTGSTNWLLKKVNDGFDKFKDETMHFNKVDLYKYDIKPIARSFIESTEQKIPNDGMKELVPMILTSRVIILATPIYWFTVSGIMKNFLDRWYDFSDDKGKLRLDGKGIAVVTAHANPSSTMSHPVFKMVEEGAKFCNMVYLGGVDTITSAQPGSNEYEISAITAELLGKRVVDFLKHSL